MPLGQGSIDEFALAELPVSVTSGIDLAVNNAGVVSVIGAIPTLLLGNLINVPPAAIVIVGQVPTLLTGVLLSPSPRVIVVSGQTPTLPHNVNLLAPVASPILLVGRAPDNIGTGAFIDSPTARQTVTIRGGALAEVSIAEFGLTEGPGIAGLSTARTYRIQVTGQVVQAIQAGWLVIVPVGVLTVQGRIPEIDARRRRLRATSMLS